MSFKLSCKNIQKSFKDYSIYFITLIFGVAIFYVFNSIDAQSSMLELNSSKNEMVKNLVEIIGTISIFVSIILGFLIVYANNFLIRRRKKELGLYMTLGMGKGKISKLLLTETIIIGVISLVLGLIIGIFSSQLLSVLIAKMFETDMSKFTFVFSKESLIKTCMYFGIIYFLVMIFNIITISKYKLINLINANKKSEKIKIKNRFVTMILFILSIVFIGYSYYLLKNDALMQPDSKFLTMIISGSMGTLLFFASLSGFLLRVIQMNKKIYFKDLNMFVLRQINSRINTNMISMSLICIMLLLTIGILSGSMSLSNSFNTDLKENNLTDVTMVNYVTLEGNSEYDKDEILNLEERFIKDNFDISKYIKEYVQYNVYNVQEENTLMSNFLLKEDIDKFKDEYGDMFNLDGEYLRFMKESEYNKLMDIYNKENFRINLKDNEYVVVANFEKVLPAYNNSLKNSRIITINGKEYIPQRENCIEVTTQNASFKMNLGIIVIKDEAIKGSKLIENIICGNYLAKNDNEAEKTEENFIKDISTFYKSHESEGLYRPYEQFFTKIIMNASSLGIKTILTFIGLYLGIIFSITSAAILAIQQLSQSSDNKERYEILRKIGADTKIINRSLFIQIAIFFMLPLSLALVHSIVGLSEINKIIAIYGEIDLTSNIIITTLFILLVYGGYFIATYLGSKSIIKER
jgi:putative ABC transport system permease protein